MMTNEECTRIISEVHMPGYAFLLIGNYLQVQFIRDNRRTGRVTTWKGRKWLLSQHMTRSELVLTAFKAVMTAEEHEIREAFTYKGRAIFGPHIDVEALHGVSDLLDARP